MTALVLYWSLTGTTRRVAESIADGLCAGGVACELRDLRAGVPSDAASYDIIGVGFPVHWFRPPIPVSQALAVLGPLDDKSVFAFSLNGSARGAGLNRARAALVRAGGLELGAFSSYGEDRFYPYVRLGALFSPGHPTDEELAAAYEFGREIAAAHLRVQHGERPPTARPPDPSTHPIHALERFVTGPRLTRVLYSRLFRVDPDRCIRCGKCAKGCPVENIPWARGELPSWGRDCVMCLNCVAICPEEAVSCPMDWAVFRPFLRWNVNHAWRDPDLDHVRVEFERGKITRI